MIFIVSHYKSELYLARIILSPADEVEITSTKKSEDKMLNLVYLLCLYGFFEVVDPKKEFKSQIGYSILLKKKSEKFESKEKELCKTPLLQSIKKLGYKVYNEDGETIHLYPSTMKYLFDYFYQYHKEEKEKKDINMMIYILVQENKILKEKIKEWK